jgi:hypothetical protein
MKYFLILFFLLPYGLKSQQNCDTINYHTQQNKEYITIAGSDFHKPAFLIQDSCFYQNRFIAKANQGLTEYYPAYILSTNDIHKTEEYMYKELSASRVNNLTRKENKALIKNYFRQYVASIKSGNEIEVSVFFCGKNFLSKYESFKYTYLSPLIVNSANQSIYSCKLSVSRDFKIVKSVVFRKVAP